MTLLDLLIKKRILIPAGCGGRGRCGQCRIRIVKPRRPDELERQLIPSAVLKQGYRLACRRDARERFVPRARTTPRIRTSKSKEIGLALDLGTTTIKGLAVDLRSGRTIGKEAVFNPQNVLGADVISRIGAALEGKYTYLRKLLMSGVEEVIRRLGIKQPVFTAVAANPVMRSFYLNDAVQGLAQYPFESVRREAVWLKNPTRYVFPVIGGFVGGDTIAGLLADRTLETRRTVLYADLGTNGEVGLVWGGKIVLVSTAAGPAFEGSGIKGGSLALPGAIDRVGYQGGFRIRTIGNRKPVGFCASGLLDLLAVLRRRGWLTPDGRLMKPVEIGGIAIEQQAIRQLQLAIGAIHVGIMVLLLKYSIAPAEVSRAVLTGEFGAHLNPRSLVEVGLIPKGIKKISIASDLPLQGALKFLLDANGLDAVKLVHQNAHHLELAQEPGFERLFIGSLRLAPWD